MKVSAIMTESPASCSLDMNLGAVAEIMWKNNCGFLPVVGSDEKVVGVLTDRDMCIAMATRNQLPADITAQQVTSGTVIACQAEDDITTVLETMGEKGVRRLPVLDAEGKLAGILSVDDIVRHADAKNSSPLSYSHVVQSLKKVFSLQTRSMAKAASA